MNKNLKILLALAVIGAGRLIGAEHSAGDIQSMMTVDPTLAGVARQQFQQALGAAVAGQQFAEQQARVAEAFNQLGKVSTALGVEGTRQAAEAQFAAAKEAAVSALNKLGEDVAAVAGGAAQQAQIEAINKLGQTVSALGVEGARQEAVAKFAKEAEEAFKGARSFPGLTPTGMTPVEQRVAELRVGAMTEKGLLEGVPTAAERIKIRENMEYAAAESAAEAAARQMSTTALAAGSPAALQTAELAAQAAASSVVAEEARRIAQGSANPAALVEAVAAEAAAAGAQAAYGQALLRNVGMGLGEVAAVINESDIQKAEQLWERGFAKAAGSLPTDLEREAFKRTYDLTRLENAQLAAAKSFAPAQWIGDAVSWVNNKALGLWDKIPDGTAKQSVEKMKAYLTEHPKVAAAILGVALAGGVAAYAGLKAKATVSKLQPSGLRLADIPTRVLKKEVPVKKEAPVATASSGSSLAWLSPVLDKPAGASSEPEPYDWS